MPKYYCDYCDVYLTHDSASVRKTHNTGWKHKMAVRQFYQQFAEDWTQALIDSKVREMESNRVGGTPASFLPFPPGATGPAGGMLPPPYPVPGMPPGGPPMGLMPNPGMPHMPMPPGMFPPHEGGAPPPGMFPGAPFPGAPFAGPPAGAPPGAAPQKA
eukprot:Phypoly_transcript_18466.p2 GENE.Phypoly_transcript_18466~~Phypoly_transcript_18466.p2  ORF type:complete len:158 (+),score=25.59 Phypoly_transcript_18466:123-596(+)